MTGRRRSTEALIMLGSRAAVLALNFAAGVVTARALAPALRGEYSLFATVSSFVLVFSNLGLAEAIVYFENRGEADVRRSVTSAFFGFLIAVAGVALASIWLVPWLAGNYFPSGGSLLGAMALAAGVATVLHSNLAAHYQAQRRFFTLSFVSLVRPTSFIAALLWVWWTDEGLLWAASLFLASSGLAALVTFAPLARYVSPRTLEPRYLARLFGFSVKSYANVAINQLNYRVDMLIVGYLLTDLGAVAAYSIAASLASLIWVVPDSYGQVIYPRLASHETERARTHEAVQGIRYVLVPVSIGAVLLFAAGPIVVPAIFGSEYAEASRLVRYLLPGIVAMSVCKMLTRYFASRNRHQLNTYWIVLAVVANAASNFVLVPRLGASGAALSASIAWLLLLAGLSASFLVSAGMRADDWAGFPGRDFQLFWKTGVRLVDRRNGS